MTEKPEPHISIGDDFQKLPAPHRRWRVTGRDLVFRLACIEELQLLRIFCRQRRCQTRSAIALPTVAQTQITRCFPSYLKSGKMIALAPLGAGIPENPGVHLIANLRASRSERPSCFE